MFQTKITFCRMLAFVLLGIAAPLLDTYGQGAKTDYERAEGLRALTRNKIFRHRVEPQWIADTENFWYHVSTGPGTHEFVVVNPEEGSRAPAFDHERLSAAIARNTDLKSAANRLPFRSFEYSSDRQHIFFNAGGSRWNCSLDNYKLESIDDTKGDNNTAGTLKSLTTIVRSSGQGEDTYIHFVNRYDEPIDLYWLAGDGSRRKYASLPVGGEHDQHTFAGHAWLATTNTGKPVAVFRATAETQTAIVDGSVEIKEPKKPTRRKRQRGAKSPDGKWRAFVRNHNVVLQSMENDAEYTLSKTGSAENAFKSGQFYWSPDSRRLVAVQERAGERREVHIVESSPADQLQPKLHTMVYAKPGDKLAVAKPRLFDTELKSAINVSDELFANAWSVSNIRWQPDSQRFTFLYNQRGHQVLRIVVVDAETGEAAALVDETSETFIDYAYKSYSHFVDSSNELIWMSERDGWNHLYLYDTRTGDTKHQITKGRWVIRGVERVDEQARRIYFRASGVYPEQDPYYVHYGFVDFDGSNLTFLTAGNGTHKIEYAPRGAYFIDRYSRVDLPTVTELRRSKDGSLVCELERGDASELLATGWKTPERFVAKARDGKTDIYGVIYRPTNFDTSKTYPIIEKIYAGPHGSFVPKSFAPYRREQSYAELGFIVVQIDGMGTSNRSKAFHNVCWKNLGDSGFPDRILWLQEAARKYPEMDIARIGIFGGSAGGQSTLRALLAHGDFYKVGVADCGCHDNRMDKVWWNELWMGWPIGPHYEKQSNVTQAHRLTGKLLLTVGELDKNVDPASTMQVVDALIKADKDFDFLIVPGAGHGVGESPYANRRRQDFFVRHLQGVEPRHEETHQN